MVLCKKSLMLLGISMSIIGGAATEETFLAEKPAKKNSLSKARRESLDILESLGHDLATEIEEASRLLQDVMWTVRDIAEGDTKSPCMKALQKERAATVASLKKMRQETQERARSIMKSKKIFTNKAVEARAEKSEKPLLP